MEQLHSLARLIKLTRVVLTRPSDALNRAPLQISRCPDYCVCLILLVSNLVAQKICLIGPFAISGAILFFPITYTFGDIFTEVYGFAASRRAIWLGFFGTALLYLIAAAVIRLPAARDGATSRRSPQSSGLFRAFLLQVWFRTGLASSPAPTRWPG